MWLAHHDPAGYDRCVMVGGRPVCRRCLVLYPLALVVLVAAGVAGWSGGSEAVVLLVFPLPAVVEFVLEHRGVLRYNPVRQILVTIPFPAHWDPKLRIPRGQVVAAASIVSPKY